MNIRFIASVGTSTKSDKNKGFVSVGEKLDKLKELLAESRMKDS